MRRTVMLAIFFLTACWPYEKYTANMYVVRYSEGYRVVGFFPAKPLRERAYFFTLLAPLRMELVTDKDTVRVNADLHILSIDKQRSIERALLVSDPTPSPPKSGVILLKRMHRIVGSIYLKLNEIKPHVRLDSIKVDTFRGSYHVYAFTTALPAARNYPELFLKIHGDTYRMVPLEKAPFLTKYHGREYHVYQEWYDKWTFVSKSDTPVSLKDYNLIFRGELLPNIDTTSVLK